jgi:hypothetical protein
MNAATQGRDTMENQNLGSVVADATMRAAVDMIHAQGNGLEDINSEALVVALRREAKAALSTIIDEGKALLDSGFGGWTETLIRTECVAAAQRAVSSI